MKKSLSIIALAALAFVGCSKIIADAPINKTEDKGQEINFQVATYMGHQGRGKHNDVPYQRIFWNIRMVQRNWRPSSRPCCVYG